MSPIFMDLGWIFEPGRSKMEARGGHFELQGSFSYQRPTRCGPSDGFFEFLKGLFFDFVESFFMFFLMSHFFMKKHDFSRIVVSSRREHHFWRSGADFERLGSDQNEQKVVLEGSQKAIQENQWKSLKNIKICKTRTVTKCRIYRTDLCFHVFKM